MALNWEHYYLHLTHINPNAVRSFDSFSTLHSLRLHSKNTRVSMTRKRVRWGQTPFRVSDDPEINQLDAKYDPELGQSDPIICQFDWFPGHRWPGMEFGPNGPFSGSRLTRMFLECETSNRHFQ